MTQGIFNGGVRSDDDREIAVSVHGLSKTFYTGFFGPIPYLRERSFGRLHRVIKALKGVSFDIKRGEIFALLGANGAGKSTTMKILMGLIQSTSGEARIFGRTVREARAREGVGYLPENPSFYEELTPRELLRLFSALHGLSRREAELQNDTLIERVGMSYAADRPLRKLSKGMHQRIGVAQALINQPSLIVLDEPFSGLDPIGRKDVREILLEERARGATLLFTSHILPDVEALCDRFLILQEGQVTHQGGLADLALSTADIELVVNGATPSLIQSLLGLEGCTFDKERGENDQGISSFRLPHVCGDVALSLVLKEGGSVYSLNRSKPQLESLFLETPSTHTSSQEDRKEEEVSC